MISRKSWIFPSLVVLVGLFIGWLVGRSAIDSAEQKPVITERDRPVPRTASTFEPLNQPKVKLRNPGKAAFDLDAIEAGAIPGQRWISFADRAALEKFLRSLDGTGISVLGSIDALNALRIGFSDAAGLAGLLDGSEDNGYIFPVDVPSVGTIQDDALGFGRSLLQWLGLSGDLSEAGNGIKVAVLDTGVGANSVFSSNLKLTNLIDLPSDLSQLNGHGTAVASLIASSLGLAPGASLLSYRVANDNGSSDSFTLAQGIIAAADAGAHVINISMGSSGDSSILRSAIEYAQQAGAVIVASAGNDGGDRVAYPAAYEGVVAVGAIDAKGDHLTFSNSGNVTISAPGLDVYSASPGDGAVLFTGTSSSAPIVSGAIANLMTTQNVSASQALNLLLSYSNDAGAPGTDPSVGEGYLDLGRIARLSDPTATDAAIASNYVVSGDKGDILQVTVENRGNTTLINAPVTVTTASGQVNLNVAALPAGKTQTFELPLTSGTFVQGQAITIESNISLSGGGTDLNPSNNRRVDVHTPAENP